MRIEGFAERRGARHVQISALDALESGPGGKLALPGRDLCSRNPQGGEILGRQLCGRSPWSGEAMLLRAQSITQQMLCGYKSFFEIVLGRDAARTPRVSRMNIRSGVTFHARPRTYGTSGW